MVVIKVEMWPGGNESRKQEFARAEITNLASTTIATQGGKGDYHVRLSGGIWGRTDVMHRTWKTGKVKGFDRVKRGIWDLLFLALLDTVGYRNL